MKTLLPADLRSWNGRIVDVREPDEFARQRLDRAVCVPLGGLAASAASWDRAEPILVVCRSGARSRQAAQQLDALGFSRVATLDGGLQACPAAGVPVLTFKAPIPLQRQVLIGAGTVLLTTLALSLAWAPLIALTWLASVMLVIAGVSGLCPMARILAAMPWNAPRGPAASKPAESSAALTCACKEG